MATFCWSTALWVACEPSLWNENSENTTLSPFCNFARNLKIEDVFASFDDGAESFHPGNDRELHFVVDGV
ncbi:hypothetical protein MHBO_000420 [Bonamia ostreae]|uniref:Uncharacterized protein n=1 Tax=Bonamia ostreae TaxID=126728 RepID=A0ABV2AFJ7_9EUKA